MRSIVLFLGIFGALLLHAGILLFGGLLFNPEKKDHGTLQQVELLSEDDVKKKDEEKPKDLPEELKSEDEKPPDAAEIMRNLEPPVIANDAPALDAASLSAIEAALNGQGGGGGDFASALDFTSG